jgi:membrane protein DedA with SNARE-associated domain
VDSILSMLDTYGVGLLFVVILLKEIGVPVPVPGDLLMIVAGARAAAGTMPLWAVMGAAFVAGVIGAFVQYLVARGPGRGAIYRYGRYVGLTTARLDKAAGSVKGRGWVAVALVRALPGLRIGSVAACGIAAVPSTTFAAGLVAGTLLFVAFHVLLGYVAGPSAMVMLENVNIPLWAVILALAIMGLVVWVIIRAKRRKAAGETSALFDWADACCPVCLAAGKLTENRAARPATEGISEARI